MADASDYQLVNYAAAFMDLMGQKDRILALDRMPTNEVELKRAQGILRDSLGVVLDIRRKFRESTEKYRVIEDERPEIPAQLRKSLRCELKTFDIGVSDSFILAVPMDNPERPDEACVAIRMLIAAVGGMMMDAHSSGRPLRAGVDIGVGVRLDNGELYGPALVRPYVLESKIADYPRAVVGSTLRDFLVDTCASTSTNVADGHARVHASKALQMVGDDHDGLQIVDYLGPSFQRREMAKYAFRVERFANESRDYFTSRGDSKLSNRYGRLKHYVDSRLPAWSALVKGA